MAIKTYYMSEGNRPTIDKDPAEVLDYALDMTGYLQRRGETIATASVVVAAGLAQYKPAEHDDYTMTVYLSGGAVNQPLYEVRWTAVTSAGRTVVRRIWIRVKPL